MYPRDIVRSWWTRGCLAVGLMLAATAPAAAHQGSFSYARLAVSDDAEHATYEIKINTRDLYDALGFEDGRDASDAEIHAGKSRLYDYLLERVTFELPDDCKLSRGDIEILTQGERFARLDLDIACARPMVEMAIEYDLFFDMDQMHIGLLSVGDEVVNLTSDNSRFEYWIGEQPVTGIADFIRSGVEHILYGIDHILFLVSLLVMAVIARDPESGWAVRGLRDQIAYTGVIVTSFTLAHSITLIGAALGWFALPSRFVESAIAASIVYVAIENVVRPDPPRRYAITFGFGLVHGLGFAAMLSPLLPPEGVIFPLLTFNLGVEIGQLAIVLVAMPVLWMLASKIGANTYRRYVLPTAGAVLASVGLIWLIERAFDVTILGL